MSATKPKTLLPTEGDLDEVGNALAAAFNAVELFEMRLRDVVAPWMAEGTVLEAPTWGTIGLMIEIEETIEADAEALQRMAREISQHRKQLACMIREREPVTS